MPGVGAGGCRVERTSAFDGDDIEPLGADLLGMPSMSFCVWRSSGALPAAAPAPPLAAFRGPFPRAPAALACFWASAAGNSLKLLYSACNRKATASFSSCASAGSRIRNRLRADSAGWLPKRAFDRLAFCSASALRSDDATSMVVRLKDWKDSGVLGLSQVCELEQNQAAHKLLIGSGQPRKRPGRNW